MVWYRTGVVGSGVPGFDSAAAIGKRTAERRTHWWWSANDRKQQSTIACLCRYADYGVVPFVDRSSCPDANAVRARADAAAIRYRAGAGCESTGHVVWKDPGAGSGFLPRGAAPSECTAWSGSCIDRLQRAVARQSGVEY